MNKDKQFKPKSPAMDFDFVAVKSRPKTVPNQVVTNGVSKRTSPWRKFRLPKPSFKAFRNLKRPKRKLIRRAGLICAAFVLVGSPLYMLLTSNRHVNALTGNATLYPDGDSTAGWDLCTNVACGGTAHYTLVDESSLNTGDYVNMDTAGSPNDGEIDDYTMQNPTINGTFVATTQVQVKWYAVTQACNGNSPSCDAVTVNIFINGSLQTGQQQSLGSLTSPSPAQLYTTTFNGNWGAINDLRIVFTRNRVGGGNSANADDDVRIYQAYADVTYTYFKNPPLLTQKGYIWENDDGYDVTTGDSTKYPTAAVDTGSGGTVGWTSVTNILTSNDLRANAGLNSFNSSTYLKTTGYNFDIPFNATINGITVTLEGIQTSGKFATLYAKLVKNDSLETATKTGSWPSLSGGNDTTSILGGVSDLWSGTWSAADINSSTFGVAVQGYVPDNSGLNSIQPDAVTIKINYTSPSISQLAGSNTSITMRAGERATLRTQMRNTGGPVDAEKFGLFYDKNDGLWTKVEDAIKAVTGNGSGCGASGSNNWICTTVENDTDNTGTYASLAFSPTGVPYISYYDSTATALMVAQYVGSGGSGCGASGSSAWTCTVIESSTAGNYSTITFSPSGVPYISYYDGGSGGLGEAHYVGNGTGTGCATNAWTCSFIDTGTNLGQYTSIAFDPVDLNPYISYYDTANTSLMLAQYVGTGGTGCDIGATWTCITIDNDTDNTGQYTSIAFNTAGTPYISYHDATATALMVANYDGDGTPSGCGASGSSAWTCTTVDDGFGDPGQDTSIAFSPSGVPYVAHNDATETSLDVAQYVGSGGSGCGAGGSTAWTCTTVDNDGNSTGFTPSIAFNPAGIPFISYYDFTTSSSLKTAQYVGSGGSGCGASGSTAWICTVVDNDTDNTGFYSSLAFSPSGRAFIAYHDSSATSLMIAEVARAGELTISPSYGGSASLTESHADMTAYDNAANRDDADCITSGTWNNGKVFLSEKGNGLSVADGTGTAQCTEVAWTVDTSQAQSNTTYRFVIATDDAIAQSRGKWRGPIGIENYPTLTIEDDAKHTTTQIASKDRLYTLPDCSGSSDWGCDAIDVTNNMGGVTSIALDASGNPWIAYQDTASNNLKIAEYVGSGGNCDTVGAGSDAWNCTTIDATNIHDQVLDMAISNTNEVWISYYDNTVDDMKVAHYVGSGGNCDNTGGSDAWECTAIDATTSVGSYNAIIIDETGSPKVAYYDGSPNNNLKYAEYVGAGGNCDATGGSDAWQCTTIDVTNNVGLYIGAALDSNGIPWISYYDATSLNLKVAKFVGAGGNCDATGGSDAWQCTDIDATDTVGQESSIAFDASGAAWVAYYLGGTEDDLAVAKYVGSGGNCDTVGAGSDAWECTTIATTDAVGAETSIAMDASGVPWITYRDVTATHLEVARYVGSGGNCDTVAAGSDAWECTTIDTNTALHGKLAFNQAGNPIISYHDTSSGYNLRIATYKGSLGAPMYATTNNTQSTRNAKRSSGRYTLSSGKAAASSGTACSGATHFLGLCGITTEDGQYDSIVTSPYERPVYTMKARFDNNATLPTLTWAGTSSEAASGNNIRLQVYRYGSTNAWETITTNSTCAASTACVLSGLPSGTGSEYFQTDGSNYNVYLRVYQVEDTTNDITFMTDSLKAIQQNQQMRHGRTFNRSLLQPFLTEQR